MRIKISPGNTKPLSGVASNEPNIPILQNELKSFKPRTETQEFLKTCPVNSTWTVTSQDLGASAVVAVQPYHPNWPIVERRLTLYSPLDFSPLPSEQAISYLGTPGLLDSWSRPVALNPSADVSTRIENFFGSTSGGMMVTAGESSFFLDSNAARNPEYLTTLLNIIKNKKDVVFTALESHSSSLESSHSTSMVLKESSPIAMKLLDLTPQMFLIETNSSPLSVLVEGSFPNPLMIEASRQLLNNSLIEPNYISSNTTEVLPSPSDSKNPPSLEVGASPPAAAVAAAVAAVVAAAAAAAAVSDPIIKNKSAITDAMNAAIASHTQINRFLGIKSKDEKRKQLGKILGQFTDSNNPDELKRHLKEFIEHAKQHRALQFFDSPTKSIRAFNNKLDDNLRAVVDEIIKPKSGDESTPKHI